MSDNKKSWVKAWRADLARVERERDTLRADLAKARARCAELAAALTSIRYQLQGTHDAVCVPTWTNYGRHEPNADCCLLEPIDAALASDGTSALAAVRLMQRLAKMVTPPKERPADLGLNRREKLALEVEAALTEAFGSGE